MLINWNNEKNNRVNKLKYYQENFGKTSDADKRKFYENNTELEMLAKMEGYIDNSMRIDDITWNDLNMDNLFIDMDTQASGIGREYLYQVLRNVTYNKEELYKRGKMIEGILEDEKRHNIKMEMDALGFIKNKTVIEHIGLLKDARPKSNLFHYIGIGLIVISVFIMLRVWSVAGLFMTLITVFLNVMLYYRYKPEIMPYMLCLKLVSNMSVTCGKLLKLNKDYLPAEDLKTYEKEFSFDRFRMKFISSGSRYNGSIIDALFDYVRMVTHIDIIMYNMIISHFTKKSDLVLEMYKTLGYIETMYCIASYRKALKLYTVPEFLSGDNNTLEILNMYHPLIENPVTNSIKTTKNVLLTGSNASGKSTFLRTVGMNIIMAQTIYTCTAEAYKTGICSIYSSMSLKDSLLNGDSYYMAEIKAIKRILDSTIDNEIPVIAFVDEVLRGTNTVERIAASTEILRELSRRNAIVFAATHDIELTTLLVEEFDNYHFEEDVTRDDITFNYILKEGPSVTRNAIKLLKILKYNDNIIENSEKMAKNFINTGKWSEGSI